jgi:hypothetical protein
MILYKSGIQIHGGVSVSKFTFLIRVKIWACLPIATLSLSNYNKIIMRAPSFEQFEATSLYCSRCKAAVPVRKRLLLVLPEGDEYEYLCAYCSSSVGIKIERGAPQVEVLIKP